MSMNPSGLEPIPEETRALMQRLSPKGTMVSQLRDALGPIYSDEGFVHCPGGWRWSPCCKPSRG